MVLLGVGSLNKSYLYYNIRFNFIRLKYFFQDVVQGISSLLIICDPWAVVTYEASG